MEEQRQPDRRWIVLVVFAVIAAVIVAAVLLGQGDDSGSGEDTTPATQASTSGCEEVETPEPKTVSFKAPDQVLEEGEPATAVVKTSCGTFEIELDTERAPKTANSFAFLA
nr:peptidylprolyl isomerase [Actinomycetota bacterium]